jgi:hypothetical protein
VKRWLPVVGVLGGALLGGLLLRAAGPAPGPIAPQAPPAAMPQASPWAPHKAPPRDVFRYADEEPAPGAGSERPVLVELPTVEPPPPLEPPAPDPVKLIGLVQRGGVWRAALSIHGDVVVLGVGEGSGGYELVALDESEGVSVRDPQGQELKLILPDP